MKIKIDVNKSNEKYSILLYLLYLKSIGDKYIAKDDNSIISGITFPVYAYKDIPERDSNGVWKGIGHMLDFESREILNKKLYDICYYNIDDLINNYIGELKWTKKRFFFKK